MSPSSSSGDSFDNTNSLVSDEITDFFKQLNLNIVFEDGCLMNNCNSMFDYFRHNVNFTCNDVMSCFKNNYESERGTVMNTNIVHHVTDMNNTLADVYNTLDYVSNDSVCLRKINNFNNGNEISNYRRYSMVFVNAAYGKVFHGARTTDIDYTRLQYWVNAFHSYQFENPINKMLCGFILHLLYVRISPHSKFNLAMARYLFLENKLQINDAYVPISPLHNDNVIPITDVLNEIYTEIFGTLYDLKRIVSDDYYSLTLNSKLLKRIYYVIYASRTYAMCCKLSSKFRKQVMKNIDFMYIFCFGHGFYTAYFPNTEQRNMNNIKFVNWLNGTFFDYTKHKKFINLFGVERITHI